MSENTPYSHKVIERLSALRLQPTVPQLGLIKLGHPRLPPSPMMTCDTIWIKKSLNRKRRFYIRDGGFCEMDFHADTAAWLLCPKLWILVIFIDADHALRIPVWRGCCPFTSEPKTDAEVINVLAWCIEQGGIQKEAAEHFLGGAK